ncbi:efflux RND transporter periplasmic adaptor subunit [Paraburkholderia phytofirmans]|uniref:Efflux transporter, RND family, MFP subunit n=1 Tax=Paraburkholderia phytofirmans (strain DSM 17436 / LMG 22146 / PsJN) TaxID=398527 RepID=B2TEL0_PARPJ|nr:efflux RND transporter periplasmic adaptor subunit [Paraburkholderia phytofirmans]ACD18531.1 efflux transporter, RND family, MFP subunit [Paraburkholderia phytofirmans PsJN]
MIRRTHVFAACLVLTAFATLSGCHEKEAPAAARPPVNVGVVDIALRDVPVVFDYVGQTESSQQVEIRARVNGFLEKRVYQEGSMVHQGDVMFVMDRKPFQASLDAARAEFAQQKARLDTAQANLNRVRPLVAKNALSQKDLDDSIGQQQAAAAALEQARANVTSANLNLGYTTITAPVTGLSSFAKKQDGSYIDSTNSLLTYVAKLDPMWINFSLSENEMLQLRTQTANGTLKLPQIDDLEAVIVLADGSIYPQRGHIAFRDASLSSETGTYLIRAAVPNPDGALRPGQFVRIKLLGAERSAAVAVPQGAILQGPRGEYVWTVDKDNKAQQRAIETGEWNGNDWVVNSGLRVGDRVVIDNTLRLMPGAAVNAHVVPMPAASVNIAALSGGGAGPAGGGGGGTSSNAASVAGQTDASAASGTVNGAAGASANAAAQANPKGTSANATNPSALPAGQTAVFFALGSASLDSQSADALAGVARRLLAAPGSRAVISGYTDSSGSYEANVKLAAARAATVRSALIVAGVDVARIDMRRPARIVASDAPDKSRRVDVTLAPSTGG